MPPPPPPPAQIIELEAEGSGPGGAKEYHVAFFARHDIRIGQELTFDYRFKEEAADHKVECQCGAPNCKGTLN